MTVDVHCHAFNGSDLPITGFVTRIVPAPERFTRPLAAKLHAVINAAAPSTADELPALATLANAASPITPKAVPGRLAALLPEAKRLARDTMGDLPPGLEATLERLFDVLDLVAQPRHLVAATLVHMYQHVDLFTPALVDYDLWSDDSPETPIGEQIRAQEELSILAARGKIGRTSARIHPYVAFDPLREVRMRIEGQKIYDPYRSGTTFQEGSRFDPGKAGAPPELGRPDVGSLDIVRHAVERAGFIGVKLYPPVGFLPLGNDCWEHHRRSGLGGQLDVALQAFYSYCEVMEVPILAHASPGNGYELGYGELASPVGWARVLREFPRLRIDLGHFGHLEGVDGERGFASCEAWVRQGAALMSRYEHVYADLSNSPMVYDGDYRDRFLTVLKAAMAKYPACGKRVMYGSDFWLNRLDPNTELAFDAFAEIAEDALAQTPATREGVMGGHALHFLGLSSEAPSQNRTRLRAFYDKHQLTLPSWLV